MEEWKQATRQAYDTLTEKYSQQYKSKADFSHRPEFSRFIKHLPGKRVLDLGCGPGYHAKFFQEQGLDVTCVDLSERMIERCRQLGINKSYVMDMASMSFPPGSFDGIWALSSLIHIPKAGIGPVIDSIYNLLGDQGICEIALKKGTGEGMVPDGDQQRFFAYWQQEEFLNRMQKFKLIDAFEVEQPHQTHINMLFRKVSPSSEE